MKEVLPEFENSTGALFGNFLDWYFKKSFVRFSDGHKVDHDFLLPENSNLKNSLSHMFMVYFVNTHNF